MCNYSIEDMKKNIWLFGLIIVTSLLLGSCKNNTPEYNPLAGHKYVCEHPNGHEHIEWVVFYQDWSYELYYMDVMVTLKLPKYEISKTGEISGYSSDGSDIWFTGEYHDSYIMLKSIENEVYNRYELQE